MELTAFIAKFFSVSLFAIGLSHLLQPRRWADFFIKMKEDGSLRNHHLYVHAAAGSIDYTGP